MFSRSRVTVWFALAWTALGGAGVANADAVTEWNLHAGEVAMAACISPALDPFHESRLYAMVHIAIHDAVNAIDRRYRHYAFDGQAADGPSVDAAAAAAARGVLVAELPGIPVEFGGCVAPAIELTEQLYGDALAAIPDGPEKASGIELGEAVAAAIVALRQNDGSIGTFLDFAYTEGTAPGEYRFTAGTPFAAAPDWGEVTPFVVKDGAQFQPPPPYSVSCGRRSPRLSAGRCWRYALDVLEVKYFGADDVTGHLRTPEQTEVAFFWKESSPVAWNRLARSLSGESGLDSWQNARLFALLNMGLADGYIGSIHAKYRYRYWRPETAIQLADQDGNPFTRGNPLWAPADPTPPIPDYDSAHSVLGAAGAEVFRQFFGSDERRFDVCSRSLPDANQQCGGAAEVRRSFRRFSDAAKENGNSRVLIGYHFRYAVIRGLEHGSRIGAAASRMLKPVH